MSRLLRIEFAGALYHVMARGEARGAIFLDEEDRQAFCAARKGTWPIKFPDESAAHGVDTPMVVASAIVRYPFPAPPATA